MRIKSLKAKKCFITGAASGIGRATALAAAAEGAELFLTDINDAGLASTVAEISAKGGRVSMYRPLDISDHESVKRLAADIHAAHGSMDVLMNIAGISIWGTVEQLEHQHWRRAVDINLMGPIHVMECFLPEMIRAGRGGHLVNVSSAAGLFGLPWHAAYSASKFGLRGISEVLRFDLKRHKIGVSLVCPGAVDTGLVRTLEVPGIAADNSRFNAMRQRFQKHAKTPAQAARSVIAGIKANRYMVFTSMEVRVGYWFQRKFALPYELVMRVLNSQLHALVDASGNRSG
ncbi:MAG: SDR family oxidoreductase [Cupriavidus sp.]|nr:MAG: SDR family oxidoreductase [Cupriavidus sp.]